AQSHGPPIRSSFLPDTPPWPCSQSNSPSRFTLEGTGMLATQRSCWLFCAALSIFPSIAFAESGDSRSEWPMFGQNEQNTASNDEERKISTSNVARLAPKWVATTGGDVSAPAPVVGGAASVPALGGHCFVAGRRYGRRHLAAPAVRLRLARWPPPAHEPGGSRPDRLRRHASGRL